MIVVVMGVSGAGKTTVGRRLAARLGCAFSDADDFHPPANVARMRAGVALDDDDRRPWLAALARAIAGWRAADGDHVLACSALKAAHRAVLAEGGAVVFVHLTGTPELLAARLAARTGHFMNPALLASQIATLEAPADAITVDVAAPVDEIVAEIAERLATLPHVASEPRSPH